MQFKRSEGFRYEFPTPLQASFKILINGLTAEQSIYDCEILNISPQGMKMFSEVKFGEHSNKILQLEVNFILDEVAITAIGNIVWEKPYSNGKVYGLIFLSQPKLEELIVSELKAHRRKEVMKNKRL